MRANSEVTTGPIPVGQFVNLVRSSIRNDKLFQNQVIKGEITQWKRYSSGHTYFNLRDEIGQISAVIWKGRCAIDPQIEEGSVVVVIANLDLYPKAGKIQLIVNRIEPINLLGVLEERRKLLIENLRNEGILDRVRMKLPMIPKHIAIVTGTGSAALSDMNRLIEDRWPGLRRTIIGVTVQGERAVNEIVRGILVADKLSQPAIAERFNAPPVDVIIVGRGGGSPEDLWAFNLEPVVRAIIAATVPVVSAVGHESDLLVSDLVADVRASTPSNAIERCIAEYDFHHMTLHNYNQRIEDSVNRIIIDCQTELQLIQSRLLNAPLKGIYNANQYITEIENKLKQYLLQTFVNARQKLISISNLIEVNANQIITAESTKLAVIESSLKSVHPRKVLQRGYSMITSQDGDVIMKASDLDVGQNVNLSLIDGEAAAMINSIENGSEKNE